MQRADQDRDQKTGKTSEKARSGQAGARQEGFRRAQAGAEARRCQVGRDRKTCL